MESLKQDKTLASFLQQMLHNKFLLLTVLMAVGAVIYFCVGLFVLLGH